MLEISEPTSFYEEPGKFFQKWGAKRKRIYCYAKIYPVHTVVDLKNICRQFMAFYEDINFDICYKNHISNEWLKRILDRLEIGDTLRIATITDLASSPAGFIHQLKKIRDKQCRLELSDLELNDMVLDFSPQFVMPFMKGKQKEPAYDKTSYLLFDFFSEIYNNSRSSLKAENPVPKWKGRPELTIKDFSNDFIRFYHDYTTAKLKKGQKAGTKVKEFSQLISRSENTIYRRIAWLNAHPAEVLGRYIDLKLETNTPNQIKNPDPAHNDKLVLDVKSEQTQQTDFFRYTLTLSKKIEPFDIEKIHSKDDINGDFYDIYYYKINGRTSVREILDFCDYYAKNQNIRIQEFSQYYDIADKIIWEYSFPSKEVNIKLYEALAADFVEDSIKTLHILDLKNLSSNPNRLYHIFKKIIAAKILYLEWPDFIASEQEFNAILNFFNMLKSFDIKPKNLTQQGRPRLQKADIPKKFFIFYKEYKALKKAGRPVHGIVNNIALKLDVTPKTIYDWIKRVDRNEI